MQEHVSITNRAQTTRTLKQGGRWWSLRSLSHLLTTTWAIAAASLVVLDSGLAQFLESQVQILFFEVRGPLVPPEGIVILAIDEQSLSQNQIYQADPKQYAYLKPLQAWPWQRAAYAEVIDRLMAAGARSVALDILLATPSSYGLEDDARLQQTLQRYAGRVTLAANYEDGENRQGSLTQLTYPTERFRTTPLAIGSVNYWLEADGRVHRLGHLFPALLASKYQDQATELQQLGAGTPAFAQAVLQAARLDYPPPQGSNIYFFGPAGTFTQVPFWHVLDPSNWNSYLEQGRYFKNKIVLIGGTASSLQDFHAAPFSQSWLYPEPMAGVEIHANAIATLLLNRSVAESLPRASSRGVFVFLTVLGIGVLLGQPKRPLVRLLGTLGIISVWIGLSYVSFSYNFLILPTALPLMAIALSGATYAVTGSMAEIRKKQQLRLTLQHYAASPIVQEIISQQEDLQDLILEREQAILGKQLGGRYRVMRVLGAGGFGETYVAADTQRPGNPHCVVKLLRPVSDRLEVLQLAGRLFQREAETLERLGTHDQIPQLLAYFEEDQEFYLVQELVEGHPLSDELPLGKQIPETRVLEILVNLLRVLQFVHQQGVIHRDIKPSNIIRRKTDGKLVLIDFGAVKEIQTQLTTEDSADNRTIGIGTQGYTASEQCAGNPQFNSDIYSVGMTAIRSLTGLPPNQFRTNPKTGTLVWQAQAQVSYELARIIDRMVHYDFMQRYQSVDQILLDLEPLLERVANPTLFVPLTDTVADLHYTTPLENEANTVVATEAWENQTEEV